MSLWQPRGGDSFVGHPCLDLLKTDRVVSFQAKGGAGAYYLGTQ